MAEHFLGDPFVSGRRSVSVPVVIGIGFAIVQAMRTLTHPLFHFRTEYAGISLANRMMPVPSRVGTRRAWGWAMGRRARRVLNTLATACRHR